MHAFLEVSVSIMPGCLKQNGEYNGGKFSIIIKNSVFMACTNLLYWRNCAISRVKALDSMDVLTDVAIVVVITSATYEDINSCIPLPYKSFDTLFARISLALQCIPLDCFLKHYSADGQVFISVVKQNP